MASSHHIAINKDERVPFTGAAKKKIITAIIVGFILTVVGIVLLNLTGGHGHEHATGEAAAHAAEHHGLPIWAKRLLKDIWQNNVFFGGMSLIAVFFIAFNHVAWSGWSALLKRIPEAMGAYLPVYAVISIVIILFSQFVSHDLFHWMDHSLFEEGHENFDEIIKSKEWWLNFPFFLIRAIAYFAGWYLLWNALRKTSLQEDIEGGTALYDKSIKLSAIFLIVFGVTSSTSAWDFVMSMDPHFFSTMFGWYTLASLLVSGVSVITLIAILLKENGYLSAVNENHFHDLGKFIFGFSIFWTYVWFEQFLLIYYANIPEEAVYFVERLKNPVYRPFFFLTFFLNFILPILILMTRNAKRQMMILKVAIVVILIGHWFDFYMMMTPAVLHNDGVFDFNFFFIEVGVTLIFVGLFAWMTLSALSKAGLYAKNHPMLEESIHHDVF